MGKLFKKERKTNDVDTGANVDAFLHSSADNLEITHPPPPPPPTSNMPKLSKLDTTITRYPQALAVNQQAQLNRPLAPSRIEPKSPGRMPRQNRKGTSVRFADSHPDIIGEGGDESEVPVIEISKRKKPHANSLALPYRKALASSDTQLPSALATGPVASDDSFEPKSLKRTQTGFSSIHGHDQGPPELPPISLSPRQPLLPQVSLSTSQDTLLPVRSSSARFVDSNSRHDENRRSFIEVHHAQMREAEGQALSKASRTASRASEQDWEKDEGRLPDAVIESPDSKRGQSASPEGPPTRALTDYSPAGSMWSTNSSMQQSPSNNPQNLPVTRQDSLSARHENYTRAAPAPVSRQPQESVAAAVDDALDLFITRTKHLFELFRLHAETIQPLSTSSIHNCARAALWWYLKGRTGLEVAVRERPSSSQAQLQNELDRQQAYTDLAKSYWLLEEAAPEIAEIQGLPTDAEVVEVESAVISGLNKLANSMKRNGFLPPEDQFLPQTIDKSIWMEYPPLSQDMVALLSGNWGSGLTAMQHPMTTQRLLNAFPLADTPENFSYGRIVADVYLMEQGGRGDKFHLPCLLSMVRPQNKTGVVFMLASQNGSVQLAIQEHKNVGPVWDDVRWRGDTCTLDLKLPRGFMLAIQLNQQDYRMLSSMHEFGAKVRSTLFPRNDENLVFRNTLRSFQYIDADQNSRSFPREPISQCDVALFEKVLKESGPAGQRCWHRGFRIAVVTGPHTRTLSAVHHTYPPLYPVQFGFFRSENDAPALSLRFESGRQKGRMVLSFNDENERVKFHSILTGTALNHDEKIFADLPLKNFVVSHSLREAGGIAPFDRMPWKAVRVVNDEFGTSGSNIAQTVLSDKLKVVLEYQNGTVTDRVNVAPGELRIRLEVSNARVIRVLRQPQTDIGISVSEAQVPKELPRNMSDALQLLKNNQTIRSFEFADLRAVHKFQLSLTGFEVIFDSLATTFAIARRRMVVPIHKKWEAGSTRIQIVRSEDNQTQLLAFFEDFHHGHCLNFVLKGTDLYESLQRSGKVGIKFIDAKFPLPRMPTDKEEEYDDMAFICLDLPDLPGEHDDISILFEKEAGKPIVFNFPASNESTCTNRENPCSDRSRSSVSVFTSAGEGFGSYFLSFERLEPRLKKWQYGLLLLLLLLPLLKLQIGRASFYFIAMLLYLAC